MNEKSLPPPAAKRQPVTAPPRPHNLTAAASQQWAVTHGKVPGGQGIVIYGPAGVGKSTLASLAPDPLFLDVEGSTRFMDVARIGNLTGFQDLRNCLRSDEVRKFETVVIDTMTKVEELALAHTLATVPHEKGAFVDNIEGYGFGKGYQHLYDTMLLLLSDVDALVRGGQNVILVCHDCTADVPNPTGENFIRFEPHLQSPKSGKSSTRNRVVQWAEHVLFVGYDVAVKDGKARGSGTRTIWTYELPSHIAKSRLEPMALPFTGPDDDAVWQRIFDPEVFK